MLWTRRELLAYSVSPPFSSGNSVHDSYIHQRPARNEDLRIQYLYYQLWIKKKTSWIGYSLKPKGKTTSQIQRAFVKGGYIWTILGCQKLSLQLHLHSTDLAGSLIQNWKGKENYRTYPVCSTIKRGGGLTCTIYCLERKSRNYFFGSCFVNKDTVLQVSHKVTQME